MIQSKSKQAPEPDAEQFDRVWREHVFALPGQYEMAD
jgi:hypothetical protein